MLKDVVVEFCMGNGCGVSLESAAGTVGGEVVRKYCLRSVRGVVGGHAVAAMCGRMWW